MSSTFGSKRHTMSLQSLLHYDRITECNNPDNKFHGANMGPTWVPSAPDGPILAPWTLLPGISMMHWTFPLDIYCRMNCPWGLLTFYFFSTKHDYLRYSLFLYYVFSCTTPTDVSAARTFLRIADRTCCHVTPLCNSLISDLYSQLGYIARMLQAF